MADRTSRERQAQGKVRVGANVAADVGKLVEKAPRFAQLAKVAEGCEVEVSDAQQEFLDDFAAEIADGAEAREDTS